MTELPPSSKGGVDFPLFFAEILFASSAREVRRKKERACIWSQGEIGNPISQTR